jgi:hypothetical protein
MNLTEEQKKEIQGYIITVPKYRETYNELYDHILTSLADQEGPFHINLVLKIVNDDFGGFKQIVDQEELYHKQIGKKFNKQFLLLFVDTLKWRGIVLFILCLMFYYSDKTTPVNVKLLLEASKNSLMLVMLVGYARIVVNIIRFSKLSILDGHVSFTSSFGYFSFNLFITRIVNGQVFELSDNSKLMVVLIVFSFVSIYLRTFFKIYSRKSTILIV